MISYHVITYFIMSYCSAPSNIICHHLTLYHAISCHTMSYNTRHHDVIYDDMTYYNALRCNDMYCNLLYCTVSYYTIQYNTIQYCTVLYHPTNYYTIHRLGEQTWHLPDVAPANSLEIMVVWGPESTYGAEKCSKLHRGTTACMYF